MGYAHIMGRVYHVPGIRYIFRTPEENFAQFLKYAANSGVSAADIEAAKNFYERQGNLNSEAPILNSTKPCKGVAGVSDQIWEDLLSRYNIDNLDYKDKKQLSEDLLNQGVISTEERDRFKNMLEREEERDANWVPSSPVEYDKDKYPTVSDYLHDTVQETEFGAQMDDAAKDEIFASYEFQHLIGHMKLYSDSKRYC